MRLGGKTEVNNCVSVKNAQHPRQTWSGGSLQRGVTSATKSGPATLTVDGQPYASASAASMSTDEVTDGNLSD